MTQRVRTVTVKLPAFLASALINGDVSGLEDRDQPLLDAAHEYAKGGYYVDVGEQFFSHTSELPGYWNFAGDVAEYTIAYYTEKEP